MVKTTRLLAVAAVAGLALVGCGKSESGNPTGAGSNPAGQEQPAKTGFESLKDLTDAVNKKSSGKQSAHVKLTGGAGATAINGEGDFSFAGTDTALSMTLTTAEGALEMVYVDSVFYLKLPQEMVPGKPWVKVDLKGDNPMAQTLGKAFEQAQEQSDPRKALEQFAEVGEITGVEDDEIDGQETKHYTITVDTAKMAAKQTDPDMRKALEQFATSTKEFPVDIWINSDDLPVRFITSMPTPDASGTAGAPTKVQADYSKWGEGVTVTAPPADQVTEFPGS